MANRANSFMSGFSGGMGAMSQMINARDQRDYNAQKMEWLKQDRELQEKEYNNQMALRNFSQLNHIRNNLGDKKGEWDKFMLDDLSTQYKPLLDQQFGEGHTFAGFQGTEAGFVPRIRNKDGKVDYLRDDDGKALAIDQAGFMDMVGRTPGIVDRATQLEAQILGRGGKLPDRKETWTPFEKDGIRMIRSNLTGEEKKVADFKAKGRSGSSGKSLYSLPGGINVLEVLPGDKESGVYRAIGEKDGKEVIVTIDGNGNINTEDRSGDFSVTGGSADDYFNRLMYGGNSTEKPAFGLQNYLSANPVYPGASANPFQNFGMGGYKPASFDVPEVKPAEEHEEEQEEKEKPKNVVRYPNIYSGVGASNQKYNEQIVKGMEERANERDMQEIREKFQPEIERIKKELNRKDLSSIRRGGLQKELNRLTEMIESGPSMKDKILRTLTLDWR